MSSTSCVPPRRRTADRAANGEYRTRPVLLGFASSRPPRAPDPGRTSRASCFLPAEEARAVPAEQPPKDGEVPPGEGPVPIAARAGRLGDLPDPPLEVGLRGYREQHLLPGHAVEPEADPVPRGVEFARDRDPRPGGFAHASERGVEGGPAQVDGHGAGPGLRGDPGGARALRVPLLDLLGRETEGPQRAPLLAYAAVRAASELVEGVAPPHVADPERDPRVEKVRRGIDGSVGGGAHVRSRIVQSRRSIASKVQRTPAGSSAAAAAGSAGAVPFAAHAPNEDASAAATIPRRVRVPFSNPVTVSPSPGRRARGRGTGIDWPLHAGLPPTCGAGRRGCGSDPMQSRRVRA